MAPSFVDMSRGFPAAYNPGWGGPEYTGWMDEQLSWHTDCYIGDWSFLWCLEIQGPDALAFFRRLSVNSFEDFAIGQAKHMVNCNEAGKVVTEGILLRLGEDRFWAQSNPVWWCAYQFETGAYDATMAQPNLFKYQVQGPKSLALLEKVAEGNLSDIKFMHFGTIRIAGKEVMALRQGMSGEAGFELQGPIEDGPTIHAAILEAGQEFGIRRLGRRTAMINHLEACFPTSSYHFVTATGGYDYSEAYTDFTIRTFGLSPLHIKMQGSFNSDDIRDYHMSPIELGWGKNIKFDHDFLGRAALETEIAAPKRKIVTLEYNKEDLLDIYASLFEPGEPYSFMDMPTEQRVITHQNRVLRDGRDVGISSNPGYSYWFRKMISLTVIDVASSEPGTEVTVLWGEPGRRQKEIRATVASAPYKTDRRRERA